MNYSELWHRLLDSYDEREAKAIVQWVVEEAFGLSLADLYGGKLQQLSASDLGRLESMMQRLEKSEPVQYVLGISEFCGRRFRVSPDVLIPRQETAVLCQWIASLEESEVQSASDYTLLDIGTGSGCIAITLALSLPGSHVSAWDISEQALALAAYNAAQMQAPVAFDCCDALSLAAPQSPCWDVIVSNPPYIDQSSEQVLMQPNVLRFEPPIALFGPAGAPDLFYRRIGTYAFAALKPGGRLFFELNPLTASVVSQFLASLGFVGVELRDDQFGKCRFLKAVKP